MKYIVAVSGGVDSVVLLDMLVKRLTPEKLVVAHFDHGIRSDSQRDALYVKTLAKYYKVPFETKREELGENASEELARDRRYAFLRELADKHEAKIITAHHADDAVETIAINLKRGTGWRGLAVLGSSDIARPLVDRTKTDLVKYAKKHRLTWREDSTNKDTKYLRNHLRQKLENINPDDKKLLKLYRDRQLALRREIDQETERIIGKSPYKRHLYIAAPVAAALVLLRRVFINEAGFAPTIPQRERTLYAIKTFPAKKQFEVTNGVVLHFTKSTFTVEVKN